MLTGYCEEQSCHPQACWGSSVFLWPKQKMGFTCSACFLLINPIFCLCSPVLSHSSHPGVWVASDPPLGTKLPTSLRTLRIHFCHSFKQLSPDFLNSPTKDTSQWQKLFSSVRISRAAAMLAWHPAVSAEPSGGSAASQHPPRCHHPHVRLSFQLQSRFRYKQVAGSLDTAKKPRCSFGGAERTAKPSQPIKALPTT